MPDTLTLRAGLGLNLSDQLKASAGSRSKLVCKPWEKPGDFVLIDSGEDEPWIAQLILVFTCDLVKGDAVQLCYVKFATKLEAATRAGVTITDRFVPYDWELQYMGVKRRSQMPERAASHGIVEPSSIIGHAALTLASDGQTLLYRK